MRPSPRVFGRTGFVLPAVLLAASACGRPADGAPAPPSPEERVATTTAVELRVESVEHTPQIGDRHAGPGREFVIVGTSWKNVIPLTPMGPKASAPMVSTPYVVPMLRRQLWLLSDGRYADTVDLDAQALAPNHLAADGFGMPNLGDVVRGTLVFEAPVGMRSQALQFYDTDHGSALVPLSAEPVPPVPAAIGPSRQNDLLQLAVVESRALPSDGTTPAGQRRVVIGLRGTSRSPRDLVVVPMASFYAQTDQGCLATPVTEPAGLSRPFGEEATFVPSGPNEGQIAFEVPAETRALRLLVRAQRGGGLDVPAGAEFQPTWPTPKASITDGGVAVIHVLPRVSPPASLPTATDGRVRLALDVVAENRSLASGVELQWIQLRLQTADGAFVEPSPLSAEVPCHIPDGGVIPPGTARRFTLVYELREGLTAARLQYRGFEVEETTVDLP